MKEIIWKPELHRFSSCKEFVEEFRLGASDLILTNEYIYQPYFGAMNLECAVLYQEQYGMGSIVIYPRNTEHYLTIRLCNAL